MRVAVSSPTLTCQRDGPRTGVAQQLADIIRVGVLWSETQIEANSETFGGRRATTSQTTVCTQAETAPPSAAGYAAPPQQPRPAGLGLRADTKALRVDAVPRGRDRQVAP